MTPTTAATATAETTCASSPFTPPTGQTLLIIGQDTGSIDDYVDSISIA